MPHYTKCQGFFIRFYILYEFLYILLLKSILKAKNQQITCLSLIPLFFPSPLIIASNPVLRLTMLLHDIAKPETRTTDENGIDHFYNHNAVGADLAKAALKRLKFDNQTTHMVTTLIANHDIRFNDPLGTGRKHVRKIIHRVGADLFPYLLDVMEADISAQSDFMRLKKLTALKETREAYREILTANDCLTLKDLKIGGRKLYVIVSWYNLL